VGAVVQGIKGTLSLIHSHIVDEAEATVRAVNLLGQAHILERAKDLEELLDFLGLRLERYVPDQDFGGLGFILLVECRLASSAGATACECSIRELQL